MRAFLKVLVVLMFALLLPFGEARGDGDMRPYEAFRIDEIRDGMGGFTHPRYLTLAEDGSAYFCIRDRCTPVIAKKNLELGFTAKLVSDSERGLGLVLDDGMVDQKLNRPWQYYPQPLPAGDKWLKINYFLKAGQRLETLPKEYIRMPIGTIADWLDPGKKLHEQQVWISGKSPIWAKNGNGEGLKEPIFKDRFEDRVGLAARLSKGNGTGNARVDLEGVTAPFLEQQALPEKEILLVDFTVHGKPIMAPPAELRRKSNSDAPLTTKFAGDHFWTAVQDGLINPEGYWCLPKDFLYSEVPFRDHLSEAVEGTWTEKEGGYYTFRLHKEGQGNEKTGWPWLWYWARERLAPDVQSKDLNGK